MLKDLAACEGNMILVGGRPGTGKTRLCLELLNYFQKRGDKTLFYSLEHPDKSTLLHRKTSLSEIIDDIKETLFLKAVIIDYFQLIDFNGSDIEKDLLLLMNSAHERSVKVYMFFMLNRQFDECSPDLSGFKYKNVDIAKHFNEVVCIDKYFN
jgi:archaellum biogenesis ATPase FlaH